MMATERILSSILVIEPHHIEAVEWIERTSSNRPWDRKMINTAMEENPCLGVIAESNGFVNGFCLFELLQKRIRILKLTVDCTVQRMGVGTFMLDWLKDYALTNGRARLNVECSERYLGSHQFLRSQGFTALTVIHDYWPDEAAYLFEYVAKEDA